MVAFFIVFACAATIHRDALSNHLPTIELKTAADAARALRPLAGRYASGLFAFGLLNASFFAASILPLSTAYSVCEAFGWESGIDKKWSQAKQFYVLYTVIIAAGAGVALVPRLDPGTVMLFSQVLNGILLPFILIFMLMLVNKEKLMGAHKNGPWFNGIAWVTTASMIVLTGFLVFTGVRGMIGAKSPEPSAQQGAVSDRSGARAGAAPAATNGSGASGMGPLPVAEPAR